MKKLFTICAAMCAFGIASFANAETLYMPGNVGIVDRDASGPCNQPNVPQAKMVVDSGGCVIGYAINLPVGKTIDSVEVAYILDLLGAPAVVQFNEYLAVNRVKPQLGAIAVAGNTTQVTNSGTVGFLSMPNLSVPIVNGSVYWVQVVSNFVDVSYVAVTYH